MRGVAPHVPHTHTHMHMHMHMHMHDTPSVRIRVAVIARRRAMRGPLEVKSFFYRSGAKR